VLAWVAIRRRSWLAGIAALALIGWFAPSFRLLTVEAFPTSFYRSPTNFAARSIARGADLFAADCAACHGPGGRGDGPARAGLPTAPADLTAEHLWEHSDGDLYWWIGHGIGSAMPGFADRLDDRAIWALIDFVHANALGAAARENGGTWPRPAAAPGFVATCPDGTVGLRDLRGRVVRLVLSAEAGPAASGLADRLRKAGALTVDAGEAADPGRCTASDPAVRRAYALVAGFVPPAAGAEILIDSAGWLRESWRPGEQPDWRDPDVLLSRIAAIEAAPVAAAPVAHHVH
jgi:mono/diheme cytochrome c family protein